MSIAGSVPFLNVNPSLCCFPSVSHSLCNFLIIGHSICSFHSLCSFFSAGYSLFLLQCLSHPLTMFSSFIISQVLLISMFLVPLFCFVAPVPLLICPVTNFRNILLLSSASTLVYDKGLHYDESLNFDQKSCI